MDQNQLLNIHANLFKNLISLKELNLRNNELSENSGKLIR